MSLEIKRVTITLARPVGPHDVGAAEAACYVVEGDRVTLTDRSGAPLMRSGSASQLGDPTSWSRELRAGESAHRLAQDLLWAKYRAGKSGSDFYRPLHYPPSGL